MYNVKSSSLLCSPFSQGERAIATIHTLNFRKNTRVKGLPWRESSLFKLIWKKPKRGHRKSLQPTSFHLSPKKNKLLKYLKTTYQVAKLKGEYIPSPWYMKRCALNRSLGQCIMQRITHTSVDLYIFSLLKENLILSLTHFCDVFFLYFLKLMGKWLL